MAHDVRDVRQGLDVVHHRGLAEDAHDGREGRFGPRRRPAAFEGVQKPGLFTAHVAARAHVKVEIEAVAGAQDVPSQIARPMGFRDRVRESSRRLAIGPSEEDIGHVGLNGVSAEDRSFEDLVRVALQQEPILERPRLHLVGVGHEILGSRCVFSHGDERPFESRGETRSAPAAEVRLLDDTGHLFRAHAAESLAQCLVASRLLVLRQAARLTVGPQVGGQRSFAAHSRRPVRS